MRKVSLALVLGLVISVFAFGGEKASVKGWLADSNCGGDPAKAMSAGHKGCAVNCVKGGAKWVLVESGTKKVYQIHNQDAVKDSDVGQEVTVKGALMEEEGIHVESIEVSSLPATRGYL